VRETEKLARFGKPGRERQGRLEIKGAGADIEALERQLGDMLGLKVKITTAPTAARWRSITRLSTSST
jgi:ParB family chromosome partitioning protein